MKNKIDIYLPPAKFVSLIVIISFIAILLLPSTGAEYTEKTDSARAATFETELIFEEEPQNGVLTLYPGNYYYFYIRVTNLDSINDTFRLELSGIHAGWTIAFADKNTETKVIIAGSTTEPNFKDVLIIIKIPDTAKKDEYSDLNIKVTSENSESGITPGGSVSIDANIMIIINYVEPHVILETGESEKEVVPGGEPVSFTIHVQNLGFETIFYYPPEPAELILPEDWVAAIPAAGTSMELSPAEDDYFEVNVSAPKSAGVQERVRFKIEGRTSSANTTILPVEVLITVKQIHNLEITGPTEIKVLEPLVKMEYEITVKNSGNGPENILFSLNTPPDTSSWKPVYSDSSFVLSVGNQHTIKINFTSTADAINGEYPFNFVLNIMDSDKIVQTDIYTTVVMLHYVPDLSIDSSDIKFSEIFVEPDQIITINATVHNMGIVPAYNVTVSFDFTTKGGSKKPIGTATLPVVPAGNYVTTSIEWTVDPATSLISVELDPENSKYEVDEFNNIAMQSVFILQKVPEPPAGESSSGAGFMGIGTVGAIVVLTALISIGTAMAVVSLSTEAGRYAATTALMPLYSKVKREDVLLHETREMVYDYVKTHPGEHFRSIMSKLSLTNGTLAHHLYTLEKQEFIKSERDGPYKRFYPKGYKFIGSVMEINGLQKKILDAIEENPAITQKQLAKILGISPPTVNYHIKTMSDARLIKIEREGKKTLLFRIKAE